MQFLLEKALKLEIVILDHDRAARNIQTGFSKTIGLLLNLCREIIRD